ncbi:hypothetical protein HWV62_17892 [Athelia sp. TMB]|nr:hypothetical protein HWV62_17892 [Athelia sp. TMB]
MSSRSIIVGSVLGGLAALGILLAVVPHQIQYSSRTSSDDQPKGSLLSLSDLPLDAGDKGLDPSVGQTYELEGFAAAIRALERAKEMAGGRCVSLLVLPIDGLLDVVKACDRNDREEWELGDILKALVALDSGIDLALVLLQKHVASAQSNAQGPLASEQLHDNIVAMALLLKNLSVDTKRILAEVRSFIGVSRADVISSIRSVVQDFTAFNGLCIDDIVAVCALNELEKNISSNQNWSHSNTARGPATSPSHPNESFTVPSNAQEPESQDETTLDNELAMVEDGHREICNPPYGLHQPVAHSNAGRDMCNMKHYLLSDVLFDAANALYTRFAVLGQRYRSTSLNNLAVDLLIRFDQLGQMVDLDQSIIYSRGALELRPPGHPGRPTTLDNLASALRIRYEQSGPMTDLEQAIICHREVLGSRPQGHPRRYATLNDISLALQNCYNHSGQMADVEQAIIYGRGALELCPPGHPGRSAALDNLASALRIRFDQSGQIGDLEQAILCHREVLGLRPHGHPARSTTLNNFAYTLQTRFEQLGQIADLQQAIVCHQGSLELCPPGHPERHLSLGNLAAALKARFTQLGQMADLEQAIIHNRGSLELRPPGHPLRSMAFNNLAIALQIRFDHSGHMTDLDDTITYHQASLELRPPGHPNRFSSLGNLASALQVRFIQLGQIADLEQAIAYHRDALELLPSRHPWYSLPLNNLANSLQIRFDHLGQIEDLEQAIIYHRDALALRPLGHLERSTTLNDLANTLHTRFEQLGQLADLEQTIVYHQGALELRLPGHSGRSTTLNNLANAFQTRFDCLGQIVDLEHAINYHREALALHPPEHPWHSMTLGNLANALQNRFNLLGNIADLESAITYCQDALLLEPPGHSGRSTSLNSLANVLQMRFGQSCDMADLEQATIYYRDALELRPSGHPDRSSSLSNLAVALNARFRQLGQTVDLEEAVGLLHLGSSDTSDTSRHRYTCVSRLIALLEEHKHPMLLEVYGMALNLLQLVLAVYPDIEIRHNALSTDRLSPSLAMSAAAHAISQDQPEKAIEMLEQGRAMLWSNMRGYRQPVKALRQVNAALADRFKANSEQLEALATSSQLRSQLLSIQEPRGAVGASEARWARQRELSTERDEIIQQVRQLDGFEHFLQAVPFRELQFAAAKGPIIIVNVAQQRSDAIILRPYDAPIVLPLCVDGQNQQEAYSMISNLSNLLFEKRGVPGFSKTLKDDILNHLEELLIKPVLERLEALGVPEKSRVWWCPTSALCALPIHAAGQLPDRYVSSYTPTLSALIKARTSGDQHPSAALDASASKTNLLAIIHPGHAPKTKDEPDERLHMVFSEIHVIEKAGMASRVPVHSIVQTNANRQTVLGQLPNYQWVHFACHGRLNTSQPFRSGFELEDDTLSLSDLVHAHLPDADLAFLAACDSATSGGTSDTPDESLHLAAAVQFCGVRSVIGTLWPMADGDGPRVAQVFYRHMFKENDSRRSAEALHRVVMCMRKKSGPWAKTNDEGELLQRWANYIHIGA